MNRQKQKSAILRAAKWIENHPDNWNKRSFFGTRTQKTTKDGNPYRGFDVIGATYPYKYEAFSEPDIGDARTLVEKHLFKNFPNRLIWKIAELNDKATSPTQAARKIRSYVGHYFKD